MRLRKILAIAAVMAAAVPAAWPADNLQKLNVFPNPVRVFLGSSAVTFDNVTSDFTLRIYNVAGDLVFETQASGSGNSFVWDLKNNSGRNVASGIYIYAITNSAGEKVTGKIGIIR